MSDEKISPQDLVERLSVSIERQVAGMVKEYTEAKISEEMDPIYQHLENIFASLAEIANRVTDIAEHLADHLQSHEPGATNARDTNAQPVPADGPGNQQPSG